MSSNNNTDADFLFTVLAFVVLPIVCVFAYTIFDSLTFFEALWLSFGLFALGFGVYMLVAGDPVAGILAIAVACTAGIFVWISAGNAPDLPCHHERHSMWGKSRDCSQDRSAAEN